MKLLFYWLDITHQLFEEFMYLRYSKTLFFALAIVFLSAYSGIAATLVVTNTNDSGAGSLRAQIAAAASGDTINFTGIPANSTITLTSGQIVFPGGLSVTIDSTANTLTTIVAAANSRVFSMPNNGSRTITMINLVITGGSVSGNGGGISWDTGGSLTLIGCTVRGNTITSSNSQGAGLYFSAGGAALTVTNSTFSGNSIAQPNGQGGGIWLGSTNPSITNSTISGNTTNSNNSLGAGIYVASSVSGLVLNHVTITANTSTGNGSNSGGGLYGASGGTVGTVRNSIIAANTVTGTGPDVFGVFTTDGYNLIGIGSGSSSFVNGVSNDQVGSTGTPINPLLFALANNGGTSFTHGLGPLSPARDKASASGGAATDQRGFSRPYDDPTIGNAPGGNGADIGAFEVQTPSAAGVGIAGRIVTAEGRGIARVLVTVTGMGSAEPRVAITNPFGYYTVDDLDAGASYIVTVNSKQYAFETPTRLITIGDNIASLDFVASTQPSAAPSGLPNGKRQ